MTRCSPLTLPLAWGSIWLELSLGKPGGGGGSPILYPYAPVRLRLSDGYEECEWDAIVGFVAAPMRWAILGHAGVLQYFDLQLLGLRREALLYPNASYSGYHATHRSSPP
jgi:hypothetical protein